MLTPTSIKLKHDSQHTKTYEVSISDKIVTTVVTRDGLTVMKWIDEVKSLLPDRRIIGLNIEWRSFTPGNRNPAGILQLCVGTSCLVYQICHITIPVPPSLHVFLSDSKNTFVGVRIRQSLEKLSKDYDHLGDYARYVDLAVMAADRLKRPDLLFAWPRGLAMRVLGKDVEKPLLAAMSLQWDNLVLTEEQVVYATVDPFLCCEMARFMNVTPDISAPRLF